MRKQLYNLSQLFAFGLKQLFNIFHGAQILVRLVPACIGIPTCGIYLRRYLDIGIFMAGGLENAFEELKAMHNVFHRSAFVDDCRLKLSPEEEVLFNASDGMYMHLLIGRYTYRTLTLESDFNKRVSTVLAQYKIDLLGKPTEIEFEKEVYKHRESWISEAVRVKEEFNDMSAQEVTLLWQRIATWIY